MIKKNLFGFVAFAAVAGCSLLVSGCGNSSGSTSAGSMAGSSYVQFKYTSLAARTDLKADIAAVCFNFTDSTGAEVKVSNKYPINHGETADDITLTVSAVSVEATLANAVYYDANGNIIAAGVDKIAWNEKNGSTVGVVSSPSVYDLGSNYDFRLASDKTVIARKENVNIFALLRPDGSQEEVNVTPFASITGVDPEILSPVHGQTYQGVNYGVAGTVKAHMAAGSKALTAELGDIYVTDQQISSVALSPVNAELLEEGGVKYINMAYVEDDLGLAAVTCPIDKKVYVLNKEAFKAEAVYSEESGKGPVPDPQDVTSQSVFTLTPDGVTASENKAVVTVTAVDTEVKHKSVEVSVSYIPSAGSEALEDSVTVKVANPSVNIGLVREDESGEGSLDVTAEAGKTVEMNLMGVFSWVDSSSNTVRGYEDIAENRLPQTAAGVKLSNELTAADVSLEPAEDSVVEYLLSVPSALASDVEGTAELNPIESLPEALPSNIKAVVSGE